MIQTNIKYIFLLLLILGVGGGAYLIWKRSKNGKLGQEKIKCKRPAQNCSSLDECCTPGIQNCCRGYHCSNGRCVLQNTTKPDHENCNYNYPAERARVVYNSCTTMGPSNCGACLN